MTKTRKITLISLLTVCIIGLAVIAIETGLFRKEPDIESLPINWNNGLYIINVDDPREVVGWADYVFIGYVNSKDGTEYFLPNSDDGMPRTKYTITVMENIKGVLPLDESVHLQKEGGLTKDGKSISLFEEDFLPEEGKSYLFSVAAREDGTLYCPAPNSSIPIDENAKKISAEKFDAKAAAESYGTSEVVSRYKDAVKNEIKYNRDRYLSIYDNSGREIVTGVPVETAVTETQPDPAQQTDTSVTTSE